MPELETASETQRAIDAVGAHRPQEDWKLEPEKHAAMLDDPRAAEPLVRILKSAALAPIIERFRLCDAAANRRRDIYKTVATCLAWAGFAAIVVASLQFLLPKAQLDGTIGELSALAQLGLISLAVFLSMWLRWREPFKVWHTQRANAESARLHLFETVLSRDPGPVGPTGLSALPLKLEYIRRFLLEDQRAYFSMRGARHKASARGLKRTRALGNALIAMSFLGALVFGALVFGPLAEHVLAVQALGPRLRAAQAALDGAGMSASGLMLFLSSLGAGLHGLVLAKVLISFDERNAEAYADMAAALAQLEAAPLDEARAAAARGDAAAVRDLFVEIRELLLAEHLGWRAAREVADRHGGDAP